MFTVEQLIERLKSFPPHLRVVLPGYEGGYNDLRKVGCMILALNAHPEDYYGDHEAVNEAEGAFQTEEAVYLWGYRHNE